MRIRDPKTTALIFASGKMVVTGAKSEDDSRLASRKYARIVQKLGFDAKFSEFKIQNIVGSCDVKFPIRLEGLAYSHGQFSSYEPEVCSPVFSHFAPLPTISVAAFPRIDLSHDQAEGGLADLCIRQDFAHRRKGNRHFMRLPLLPLTPSFSSRSERKSIQHSIPSTRCYANFANLSPSCPLNAVPIILSSFHTALFAVLFHRRECALACVSPALFTSAHPVVDRRMVIHVGAKGTIEICVLRFKEVS